MMDEAAPLAPPLRTWPASSYELILLNDCVCSNFNLVEMHNHKNSVDDDGRGGAPGAAAAHMAANLTSR